MRALFYFLLILAVFFLVLFVYSRVQQFKKNLRDTLDPSSEATQSQPTSSKEEKMVTCHYCGIHLPKSEAIQISENDQAERFYCSRSHQDADKDSPAS